MFKKLNADLNYITAKRDKLWFKKKKNEKTQTQTQTQTQYEILVRNGTSTVPYIKVSPICTILERERESMKTMKTYQIVRT